MNFTSLAFLVFFPIVLILHWLLPRRLRWGLLLAASWLFYFWWDARAGVLLILTTAVTWLCAARIQKAGTTAGRKLWLSLALTVSLGCLFGFKYSGFFVSLVGRRLSANVLLPVGISFYTFQTLSYVIDVYRNKAEAEAHFGYYALFVAFFPQLVAGPIERPDRLLPQLKAEQTLSRHMLTDGGWLLLRGYFKKIVIADTLAPIVDGVFHAPEQAAGAEVLIAAVLFGFQIYCDFSGYTDIARGCAKCLGIELSENFDRPYTAVSIRDFWHRWHMSLTGWFTDYVYIPLGGSRKGLARRLLNTMVVFLLSGLWHGAAWHYVLWGAMHGLFLCAEILLFSKETPNQSLHASWRHLFRLILSRNLEIHKVFLRFLTFIRRKICSPIGALRLNPCFPDHERKGFFSRLVTFLLVSFGWIFFRAENIHAALVMVSRLPHGWTSFSVPSYTPRVVLGILCLALLGRIRKPEVLTVYLMLAALMLSWLALLAGGGNNAFIYFQF